MASRRSRALVIGADGVIGRALAARLVASGWSVTGTSRRGGAALPLDLAAENAAEAVLPDADVAYFVAAISRFADCDAAPDLARLVNVTAPIAIAGRLAARGTRVILLSTSAVFDGLEPRVPADRSVSPATVYGHLKAEAEAVFLAFGDGAAVLRLTKVLHPDMPLMRRWVETLSAGGTVSAFSDMTLAPVTLGHAVDALVRVAGDASGGIYQASARSDISYFDAVRHIARRLGVGADRVVSARAADHGIPLAQRPPFSSLDTQRLDRLLCATAPDPFEVIDEVFGLWAHASLRRS